MKCIHSILLAAVLITLCGCNASIEEDLPRRTFRVPLWLPDAWGATGIEIECATEDLNRTIAISEDSCCGDNSLDAAIETCFALFNEYDPDTAAQYTVKILEESVDGKLKLTKPTQEELERPYLFERQAVDTVSLKRIYRVGDLSFVTVELSPPTKDGMGRLLQPVFVKDSLGRYRNCLNAYDTPFPTNVLSRLFAVRKVQESALLVNTPLTGPDVVEWQWCPVAGNRKKHPLIFRARVLRGDAAKDVVPAYTAMRNLFAEARNNPERKRECMAAFLRYHAPADTGWSHKDYDADNTPVYSKIFSGFGWGFEPLLAIPSDDLTILVLINEKSSQPDRFKVLYFKGSGDEQQRVAGGMRPSLTELLTDTTFLTAFLQNEEARTASPADRLSIHPATM